MLEYHSAPHRRIVESLNDLVLENCVVANPNSALIAQQPLMQLEAWVSSRINRQLG